MTGYYTGDSSAIEYFFTSVPICRGSPCTPDTVCSKRVGNSRDTCFRALTVVNSTGGHLGSWFTERRGTGKSDSKQVGRQYPTRSNGFTTSWATYSSRDYDHSYSTTSILRVSAVWGRETPVSLFWSRLVSSNDWRIHIQDRHRMVTNTRKLSLTLTIYHGENPTLWRISNRVFVVCSSFYLKRTKVYSKKLRIEKRHHNKGDDHWTAYHRPCQQRRFRQRLLRKNESIREEKRKKKIRLTKKEERGSRHERMSLRS